MAKVLSTQQTATAMIKHLLQCNCYISEGFTTHEYAVSISIRETVTSKTSKRQ